MGSLLAEALIADGDVVHSSKVGPEMCQRALKGSSVRCEHMLEHREACTRGEGSPHTANKTHTQTGHTQTLSKLLASVNL